MAKKTHLELVQNLGRNAASDECYTPPDSVEPLLKYLNKNETYYEATSGKSGLIVEGFTKFGYKIEPSNGKDFFAKWVFSLSTMIDIEFFVSKSVLLSSCSMS